MARRGNGEVLSFDHSDSLHPGLDGLIAADPSGRPDYADEISHIPNALLRENDDTQVVAVGLNSGKYHLRRFAA